MQKKNDDASVYNPDEEYERMLVALKKFRKKKGLSANGLAKKAGISTSTMSYLVNGKTKPQLYTLLVICNVLGISIGDLFEEEKSSTEKEKTEEKSEEKLLACYRQLPTKRRRCCRPMWRC